MIDPIHRRWGRLLLALALLFSVLGLAIKPAHAAGFTVTALANAGAGSLRETIYQANKTEGADTITFTLSGTITVSHLQTASERRRRHAWIVAEAVRIICKQ
jgi:hypothetical protein